MRISCQSFSLPKAGRSFVDCEDAYFPGELNTLQLYEVNYDQIDIFRASVSDGATDSIFSKLWAQLLSFGYGAGKWAKDIDAASVLEEQSAWLDFLAKQQLPWYAEEKAELGAFAAMVGLTLVDQSKQWNAMAIGDCCIFHIRNGECLKAFPINSSAAFSNFPLLLCSVAERNSNVFESRQVVSDGKWQSNDQFLLMSDTVACWFISQIEAGQTASIVNALSQAKSLDAFVSLVNHARTNKGADGNVLMRDDDVTVTLITVADDASSPLPQKFDKQALAAASRPTVEIPKIAEQAEAKNIVSSDTERRNTEPRNTAELPPIPILNKVIKNADATESSGASDGVAQADYIPKRSYASRGRSKSQQPGLAIFIVGAIAVAAAAIGAATMFSHKTEKPKSEHKSALEANQPVVKADEPLSKQSGNHHKFKHKFKKAHSSAGVLDAASNQPSSQMPDAAPNAAPNATPSNSPDKKLPQRMPQVAPDRNSPSAGSAITNTPENKPARAPERVHMPMTAPDRTSGAPVQLPDHATEDGLDHIRSSGGDHQHHHHRSNSASRGIGQPIGQPSPNSKPGRTGDLPEDLSSQKQD